MGLGFSNLKNSHNSGGAAKPSQNSAESTTTSENSSSNKSGSLFDGNIEISGQLASIFSGSGALNAQESAAGIVFGSGGDCGGGGCSGGGGACLA